MREMKDSGIEWIGKIPAEWNKRKLFGLLNSIGSGTTPKGNDDFYDGNILWLNTGDLNDGYISDVKKTVTELALRENSALNVYPIGSVVIAMYGATIGKLGIIEEEMATNQACCVMANGPDLDNKFLFYILSGTRDAIISLAYGAGQPNISQETVKQLRIPTPIINEQKCIVNYLDKKCEKIDFALAQLEKSIEKLKEYKQSLITEAVTKGLDTNVPMKDSGVEWIGEIPKAWTALKCKYIFVFKSEKNYPDEQVLSLYRDYGVIVKDSRDDNFNRTSEDRASYKYVEKTDLVINKMKAWQGSLGISKFQGIISPAYHVCKLINCSVYPYFIHYLLRSKIYLPEYRRLSGGIRPNQWDLSYDNFKMIDVIVPKTINEQKEIADYLDQKCVSIEKAIEQKQSLIDKLTEYKKSLIYECVTGKVEV